MEDLPFVIEMLRARIEDDEAEIRRCMEVDPEEVDWCALTMLSSDTQAKRNLLAEAEFLRDHGDRPEPVIERISIDDAFVSINGPGTLTVWAMPVAMALAFASRDYDDPGNLLSMFATTRAMLHVAPEIAGQVNWFDLEVEVDCERSVVKFYGSRYMQEVIRLGLDFVGLLADVLREWDRHLAPVKATAA